MSNDNGDFVGAGFRRLDPKLFEARPPDISWGVLYKEKSDADKIRYLEKLASSMNHAAYLIQQERNQLIELCALKEQKLTEMTAAVKANNAMLQQEVTRMNEERQGVNAEIAKLRARIRELEGGNKH